MIGGGDWAENRLIPDFLRAIDEGVTVVIRNPDSIRPWQHVLEPLCGYLSLAERLVNDDPEYSEPWNFGPHDQDAKPVSWILDQLITRWGEGASWGLDSGKHRHEAFYLKLDCSKSRSRLNWVSRLNLQTCLEWIIEWHKAYKAGNDMRAYTEKQINHYENLKPV